MPENEILDPESKDTSRWRPLRARLECGESPGAIFPEIEDQSYSALRRVFKKQWRGRGVDPKQLFEAASDDKDARRHGLPWTAPARTLAHAQGAAP